MTIKKGAPMTFERWMQAVDAEIERKLGLTSDDLPDCCYRDWFDDGRTPVSAANAAIVESRF